MSALILGLRVLTAHLGTFAPAAVTGRTAPTGLPVAVCDGKERRAFNGVANMLATRLASAAEAAACPPHVWRLLRRRTRNTWWLWAESRSSYAGGGRTIPRARFI